MYHHRTRNTVIGGALVLGLGALLLIPGDPSANKVAEITVPSMTSAETVAAIDAMLAASSAPVAAPEAAAPARDDSPASYQPAALVEDVPADVAAPEPVLDPSLRPDAIGTSAVNLRAGPSTATATVTVLQPGQPVHAGASQDGWIEVTLDDGATGWVYARYLASEQAKAPPAAAPQMAEADAPRATISGAGNRDLTGRTARIDSRLAVRSTPSANARTLFRTEPGERVRIVEINGTWLRIQTADGSSGWIKAG